MSEKSTNGQSHPVDDNRVEAPDIAEATDSASQASPEDGDVAIEVETEPPAKAEPADDSARLVELQQTLATVEREKQEHWERVLRATADMENLRKRTRRELDDARVEARGSVLREMLPVIDNLERAVQHAEQQGHAEDPEANALIEGVRLVLRQFEQALEKCNVFAVDAAGKPFDPNVHEAIGQQESAEHAPGVVVQQLQRGYKIGERLLRPALVIVAKAPAAPPPSANGADSGERSAEGGNGNA